MINAGNKILDHFKLIVPELKLRMALGYAGVIQDITCWGLDDLRSWKEDLKLTFLDSEGKPKPAFYSIINTLLYP